MMLILHPRIGGPPTAAVLANSAWGLIGLGIAIAVLHVAALQFGSAIGLSLALATCVGWNLALWWIGRRKLVRVKHCASACDGARRRSVASHARRAASRRSEIGSLRIASSG